MTPHALPTDWQWVTLEESCIIKDNLRVPVSKIEREKRNQKANTLYPYYGATGKAGEIDSFIFDEENILLGEDGAPFLDKNKDKAYFVNGKYWVNNHAHILQGKANVLNNKFLMYQLNTIDYSPYVSGTTRLKLNQVQMKKITLKLPPLEIQKQIVEVLESKLEKIQEIKALLESSLKDCETYRASLLESAFRGELTPHSTDWQWVKLGEICETSSGGTPSRTQQSYWNGGIKWLKSGELNDDFIISTDETISQEGLKYSSAKILPINTLLIAMYGATIGRLGILKIETSTNQAICAISPKKSNTIIIKFLFYYLLSARSKMIQDSFGGAQKNISQTYLKAFSIPLPPLEIQKQIVEVLESKLEKIQKIKALLESSLKDCETYRASLLESAFRGELVC